MILEIGAYIDILCNKFDGFITSDKQFMGSGPLRKINEHFSMVVITPGNWLRAYTYDIALQCGRLPVKHNVPH